MPSTFFGLTIAGSGVSSYQTAINTTANNIANETTKGYSRQEALMSAAAALRVNQKYGNAGSGVEVTEIKQQRDVYYDLKYWTNSAKLGEFSTKTSYLDQIQTYFLDDESTIGFTTIFGDMFNALDGLKGDGASSLTTRNTYINSAQKLAEYFNSVSEQLSALQSEINHVMETKVNQINAIAQKIASLNKQINIIEQQGTIANELRDERNLLIDELSMIIPIEVSEVDVVNSNFPDVYTGAKEYSVKINGQPLVSTYEYYQLVCVPRENDGKVNQMDEEGLYDIYWAVNSASMEPGTMKLEINASNMTGELQALFAVRDGNNSESFAGTITKTPLSMREQPYKITVSNPTITDPTSITMPQNGTIRLGNKEYLYSSYKLMETTDAQGKVSYSYEFTLSAEADGSAINLQNLQHTESLQATIGVAVDFMGIPYYQQQLNSFVRNFARAYNDMTMDGGVDLNGEDARAFFVANDLVNGGEYDYDSHGFTTETDANGNTVKTYASSYYYSYINALNFTVCEEALKDSATMATATKDAFVNGVDAHDLIDSLLGLKGDIKIFRGGAASDFLQCLLSDIAVDTQKAMIFEENYTNLQTAITNQRMSVSSVDSDEEALNLVKFQNAYNLSAKMISVLQEMYDRLILETGV